MPALWTDDDKPTTREPANTEIGRSLSRLGTVPRVVLTVIVWGTIGWLFLVSVMP